VSIKRGHDPQRRFPHRYGDVRTASIESDPAARFGG
jgi:hypothetical protein